MTIPSMSIYDVLRNEYVGGIIAEGFLGFRVPDFHKSTGFIGGPTATIFDTSLNTIECEAPACIAAPFVTMIAKNSINLGMKGQGTQPVPVRIYVLQQLSIMTNHLSIGKVMMLVQPKDGFISCKKLTLSKFTEEDDFEVFKSWVFYDDTEIEVVSRY